MDDAALEERHADGDAANANRAAKVRGRMDAVGAAVDKLDQLNEEAKLDSAIFHSQYWDNRWYFWFSDVDNTPFPLRRALPNGRAMMKNWLQIPYDRIEKVVAGAFWPP
jgi:hypothetical protein